MHEDQQRSYHTYYEPSNLWPDWNVNRSIKSQIKGIIKYGIINGWERGMWGRFPEGIRKRNTPPIQALQEAYDAAPKSNALTSPLKKLFARPFLSPQDCGDLCRVHALALRLLEVAAFPKSLAWTTSGIHQRADALWARGELSLGGLYGTEPNISRAIHAFEHLASTGNASAHARPGFFYGSEIISIYGIPKNPERALLHYQMAANQGDRYAQRTLAHRLYFGIGVPKNYEQSLYYYQQQAKASVQASQEVIGGRIPTYTKWPLMAAEGWAKRTRKMPSSTLCTSKHRSRFPHC